MFADIANAWQEGGIMDFDEHMALRRKLIEDGRSLVVGDDETAIQPGMHFYVLSFDDRHEAPRLLRSGTFRETIRHPASALGAPRGHHGRALGMIRWDGDTESSRHLLDTLGLIPTDGETNLLAVQSLAGIEPTPIDERPPAQRRAEPLSATE